MKFSIGIPAFKAAFLRECIDSVLAQTNQEFELIIVNDGSPEDIDSIVRSYNSPKISYYKNEIGFGAENVVDNWNKCLSYCTGEYFVLLGDDDKIASNYLQVFSELIEKFPHCGVYHCRAIIIDNKSSTIAFTEPRPEFETVYDSILQRMMNKRLFFISDYMFKSNTLKANGGFFKLPLAWGSDDISSYIASVDYGIAHSNQPVFLYRRNEYTISSTGNVLLKMDAILLLHGWFISFLKNVPTTDIELVLRDNIKQELSAYIQKTKIRTIYTSLMDNRFSFFKWFGLRKKYKMSIDELLYAFILSFKEKRKAKYSGVEAEGI